MNHTLKRIGWVVLLLTVAALLCCAWAAAEDAQGGDFGDGLHWLLTGDGLLEITGTGDMPDFEDMDSRPWISVMTGISRIRIGEGVTGVGDNAFIGCHGLTAVELPDSLTRIGQQAFSGCKSLTGITIPAGVTTIGHMPFSESDALQAITVEDGNAAYSSADGVLYNQAGTLLIAYPGGKTGTFTVPASVRTIGSDAFFGCRGISEVTISEGVTQIGVMGFGYSSLTRLTIPQSLVTIEYQAFESCESLEEIQVAEGNNQFLSEDGVLFNKDKTQLIAFPAQKTGTYRVPDGVTRILDSAFTDSRLSEVVLPTSLTYIGYTGFAGCENLTDVWYMGNREAWNEVLVDECNFSLDTATIHCFVLSGMCGENASFVLWDDRLYVDGTGDMYDYAMGGQAAWRWYQFDQVYVAEGITSIGNWAFRYVQNMTEMLIPSTVTRIGVNAFEGCSKMESITIPAAVTRIEENAFMYCNALQTVYYGGSRAQWDAIDIAETGNETLLAASVVSSDTPGGSCGENLTWTLQENGTLTITGTGNMTDYEGPFGRPWESVESEIKRIRIREGVTSVGDYAFYSCRNLDSVELPDSLTRIGQQAFSDCIKLTGITIPAGVTTVGFMVFSECPALGAITVEDGNVAYSSVDGVLYNQDGSLLIAYPGGKTGAFTVPAGVEDIEQNAFLGCQGISEVTISEGVTRIRGTAFGYSSLTRVTIPQSVRYIEYQVFEGCESLEEIRVAEGNNWYLSEDGVLFNKNKTQLIAFPAQKTGHYSVPDGVTRILDSAFTGSRLTGIFFPVSLNYIGYFAFAGCDNLTEVMYFGDRNAWDRIEIIEGNSCLDTAEFLCAELFGMCGDNAHFSLWEDGSLIIYGTGDMYDYSGDEQAPWRWYQYDVVAIAEGITSIGNWAFRHAQGMEQMVIPNTVTRIGANAFEGCMQMEILLLRASVTRIEENAFLNCSALQTVDYDGSRIQWDDIDIAETGNESLLAANIIYRMPSSGPCGENVIWTLDEDGTLTISGTGDMYDTYDFEEPAPWMPYAEMIRRVVVEEGVTSVSGYTFPQCEHLTEVTLAGSVVNIGDRAFDDCILLGTVHFAEGLTSIGYSAFEGCEALRSVTLPASLRSIGEAAFASCGLTGVQVPAGTETARYYFFGPQLSENEVVIHVDLPIGVEVDFGAFSWNSLPVETPDLVLPNDLTAVEAEAFRNTGARFVWLPEGVTSIGNLAFADCGDLELIYVPSSCETIGQGAIPAGARIVTLLAEDDGDNAATIYADANGNPLLRYEDPFSGNG